MITDNLRSNKKNKFVREQSIKSNHDHLIMRCEICVEFKGSFLCKIYPVPCAFVLSSLKLQLVYCVYLHIHRALHSRAKHNGRSVNLNANGRYPENLELSD